MESSWRPNPCPRTGAGTVGPSLMPGRGDTLVGSSLARWPPDSSLLYSSPPPRSSRQRNLPSLGGSPVRICAGLGDVGGAVGPVHRAAAAMGRGSCPGYGTGRPAPGGVWLPGAPGAGLGVAPGHAGVGRLDARLCPSTASQPTRTLAAVPGDRNAGAGLDRWRLPDPG